MGNVDNHINAIFFFLRLQKSFHFFARFDVRIVVVVEVVISFMAIVVMVVVTGEGTRFRVGPVIEFFFVMFELHYGRKKGIARRAPEIESKFRIYLP